MVSEELKWVIKEKECFKIETGKVKKCRFLRMNCTKKCNNKMGGVGIADNTRNLGCISRGITDEFQRNSVHSGTILSFLAELHFPMPPENINGSERNSKGVCLYQRYIWSTYIFPT